MQRHARQVHRRRAQAGPLEPGSSTPRRSTSRKPCMLPLTIPERTSILRTLDLFRKTPVNTAVVVDEYGIVQGIVTRTDLLEAVAGRLPDVDVPPNGKVMRKDDGSILIDAATPISDVAELLGLERSARKGIRDRGGAGSLQARPRSPRRGAVILRRLAHRDRRNGWRTHQQGSGETLSAKVMNHFICSIPETVRATMAFASK